MATLVLQPVHSMERVHRSFKGDNDMLVDRLIAASARKEVATDSLVERALVPFFDSSDAGGAATFQALQPGRRGAATKPVAVPGGLKRHAHDRSSSHLAGSPPRKEGEVMQAKHARRGSKPSSSASSGGRASVDGSDVEMSSPPAQQRKPRSGGKKHQRDSGAAKPAPPASAAPPAQRQSPPRKRPEPVLSMRALAAASASAGAALRSPGGGPKPTAPRGPAPTKFAGPAFTNSPTPDCLPIPTSSLLLAEAADGLRARLSL